MTNPARHPYARCEGVGTFGKRLKAERMRRGFQLAVFSAATGIHMACITGFENRGVIPSLKNAMILAQALDCSIDYLCGLEE